MSSIAYIFRNGPWKYTYTAYEYDPRKNFDSIKYQIIDIVVKDKKELKYLGTKIFKKPNSL